jgi:transcriptional regulator with XRE-family HTH domain
LCVSLHSGKIAILPYLLNQRKRDGEMNLKGIREKRGLTQEQLADLSGVHQSVISAIERGQTLSPRLDTLKKLAGALGASVEELVAEDKLTGR